MNEIVIFFIKQWVWQEQVIAIVWTDSTMDTAGNTIYLGQTINIQRCIYTILYAITILRIANEQIQNGFRREDPRLVMNSDL